ncbi:cytidylate kinase [Spiroplasma clarkii]|uniref:Cytidylate kinase n=1 Tax=Spiroplasma clarkii TaxID=2139 RepID=A0A1Y0L2N5_9MOLU|nr:(d)CMP kinase [Spiroplasma clarkii]ARU92030.1 cytidylate kinase [Spiroplasma clarkii]ATX71361.1 cytidylate kinase [Spiroplasma clarkii]
MNKQINVAVDGTAGSGKSSVMSQIAQEFGFDFIDTGLMYRAYTKLCLEKNLDFTDPQAVASLVPDFNCSYDQNGAIYIGTTDYTPFLIDYNVAENIKYVAANPQVRAKMVELQQEFAANKGKIMVGRDITTVVLPEAELKIYFDSSPEARAMRRFIQNEQQGVNPNQYQDILRQIQQRDQWDQNRSVGALKRAADAWYLDTSMLTLEEVIDKVREKLKAVV